LPPVLSIAFGSGLCAGGGWRFAEFLRLFEIGGFCGPALPDDL